MTDNHPVITTHIKVALPGTTIDLDELIAIATDARMQLNVVQHIAKAVMRVHFSPRCPGEPGSRDLVMLEFEEAE